MEKDIDEVGKIARLAKAKFDELEKDVCFRAREWHFLLAVFG
jgi:hypothetical protein